MKFILLLGAFLSLNSSAQNYAELPFDPAYAADQPEITFDSLYGEIGQFQQMSGWHSMLGSIKSKKLERDRLKQAYERGKLLQGSDGISREEFERREFQYKMAEGSLSELENRAQMMRISVESTKMGIIMHGDQSKDLRREIAQKMKESLEFQVKALRFAAENAALSEVYEKKRADVATELFNKKVITQVEYDRRIQGYEDAKIQTEVLNHQNDVMQKSLDGLNRSLQRLFGGH